MNPSINSRNTLSRRNYILVSLIIFVLTSNVEGARITFTNHSRSGIGFDLPTSCHQQIVKLKSSYPLSSVNFNKTRPRGISSQEPIVKYSLHRGPIIIYPPDRSVFIQLDSSLSYLPFWGHTCSIRPPPIH